MNAKPLSLRRQARQDIDEAIEFYLSEAGITVATQFIDTLESSLTHVQNQPVSGSTRYAHELDIPGLRTQAVGKFPHLVFYIEKGDEIDIWRVLHGARDIPVWLREPEK